MKDWSNLARVVYRRTYSRKDSGTLENWDQTVERAIYGNVKGKNVPEEEIKALLRLAKERKAGPAGRGYWFSGAPAHAKIGGAALNNCFSGEEKFITKAGPVSFREVAGLEVTVKTKLGWKKGVVSSFGSQSVQDVVFAPADAKGKRYRSNLRHRVRVTPNHGWFLLSGEKTTSLEVGDVVQSGRGHQYPLDKGTAYYAGFQHGLIFGDGTEANHKKDGCYRFHIRLCDERTKKYVDMFEDVTYPDTYGGDPVGRLDSYENLKKFPVAKPVEYLSGFLHGWLEADGNYSKNTARLSSQDPEAKQWLTDNAAGAGYILTGFSNNNETTNYGTRHNPLVTYTLSQEEITWKVSSIETLPDPEEVFCVTVPEVGAFTLASGIYTSNCWFLTADDWRNFVIGCDLLMLGGGVGLSVEHKFSSKLPKVKKDVTILHKPTRDADYIVPDSREGWCDLISRCLESFFVTGRSFTFSTVCLRGKGESIFGFGGVASGPIPLVDFVRTLCSILVPRGGKSIRPIDAADILTAIGHMVVSGNVRRSAIIILGDCWDKEYLKAKRWDIQQIPSHRSKANYSVVCDDVEDLHPLFWRTYEHGEPFGIVNRTNIQRYGRMGELKPDTAIGVNPCAEATLESGEPCNLTETALCNLEGEEEFVQIARLMQRYAKRVTLEHYHHKVSDEVIKRNRRTGNGITGCLVSPLFHPDILDRAYAAIQDEDEKYSKELGIPRSKRTTVIKPSGTMSKVLDCFGYEGIHAAYSRYFIQRIRFAADDVLLAKLREAGHYMEPDLMTPDTTVVDFYERVPERCPVADEAWDTWKQLDVVKMAQKHWADQSVSVTVYYKKEDIPQLKQWLADNLQYLKTISFLCHSDHGFAQAPKQAITAQQYEKLATKIKPIDFEDVGEGNIVEGTECEGGQCPIR